MTLQLKPYRETNPQIRSAIQVANSTDKQKALEMLLSLKKKHPEHAYLSINLAALYFTLNESERAKRWLNQFRNEPSVEPEFFYMATQVALRLNQFSSAQKFCESLAKYEPNNAKVWLFLSQVSIEARNRSRAFVAAKKALSLSPNNPDATYFIAGIHLSRGEFSEAEAIYQSLLSVEASNSHVIANLAKCKRYSVNDPSIPLLNQSLTSRLNPDEESRIRYSLAKIAHDCSNYTSAWQHLVKANQLKSSMCPPFHQDHYRNYIDSLIETEKSLLKQNNRLHLPSRTSEMTAPILIVGMHRSGTTLIEQIFSGDNDFYPAGEVPAIDFIIAQHLKGGNFLEKMKSTSDKTYEKMAQSYTEYFSQFCNFHGHTIVDKLPSNYHYIGLFKRMFPQLKVINMQRNPMDTALSIFFENFGSRLNYTNDMSNIACVMKQYYRLMAYWHSVFGNDILNIRYEDLTTHPDSVKKQVMSFVNINLKKDNFVESQNEVETPSVWQVRQGLYQTSIERWRRYEKELVNFIPLFKEIDDHYSFIEQ